MNQEKGNKYEFYIKKYLENQSDHAIAWLWKDIPEFYLKKSGLLGDWNEHRLVRKENVLNSLPDLGADILLFKNNQYYLVQCKNFESGNYVTIHHLAGFYAMVAHFQMNGIVYYSSKLSPNLKLLKNNDKIEYMKEEIENDTDQTLKSNQSLQLQPYYYQIEAYEKLKNSKRAILNLPCGMGKTLTSILIAKDTQYKNIILISPLIAYAKQNLDKFIDQLPDYNTIIVNSEGTRDIKKLKSALQKNKKNILSFTYKSIDILVEILDSIKNKIVIIDEFHNLSKNDIFNEESYFYKLLNSDAKILFMSATPKFFHLDDFHFKFTEDIYSFSMAKGISEKHICDYEIYLPDIQIKNNLDDISKEISIKDLSYDLAVKAKYILRGIMETGSKKCIIYLRDQEEATNMVVILNKLNEYFFIDLYADSIISDNNLDSRMEILNKFSEYDGFSIICSVAILDECIDIPKCDSIFISYPSESKIRNIQRLCRANRIDKDNIHKVAKVFLWCDHFDEITIFISQLKEFDESFIENKVSILNFTENKGGILERDKKDFEKIYKNLDDLIISVRKFGYGIDAWKKNLEELKKFIKDFKRLPSIKNENEKYLSHWIYDQNYHLKKNQDIMKLPQIQELWTGFVSENKSLFVLPNELWANQLQALEDFIIQNKRLPTQGSTEDEETFKLGKWIVRNNEQYAKNEKAMKDESTRQEWIEFKEKYASLFNEKSNTWFDKLDVIKAFIEKNKRLPIENKSKEDEYDLRVWLRTQERIYNKNKFESDSEKRTEFEKVLLKYSNLFSKTSNLDIWIEKYQEFISFVETNKRLPREKISTTTEQLVYEKGLATWKSNNVQNAKIDFMTVITDIDISKLSLSDQDKHQKRLGKYNLELEKDQEILSKDYSKLNKTQKSNYDKTREKVDNLNKNIQDERYEANEKLRLWNQLKERFNKYF
jgi:superfamily II DNA or RNA helicase